MGISASILPNEIDKETFRKLAGTLNDAAFDRVAVKGVISKAKLFELSRTTDCYYAYDKAIDRYGRKIHDRVGSIHHMLRGKGVVSHFDKNGTPGGDYVPNMYQTLDNARCVLIFVTSGYASKTKNNTTVNSTDNCKLELDHILKSKRKENMIFVMMEDVIIPPDSIHVPSFLKEAMRKSPCINLSDDSFFDSKCEELFRSIAHSLSLSFLGNERSYFLVLIAFFILSFAPLCSVKSNNLFISGVATMLCQPQLI
jgi:hypothetical protein